VCGRYALHAHPDVVALQFGLGTAPRLRPRYNISPGSEVLAVGAAGAGRAAADYRWGLIPHWARDAAIGQKLANARGESLEEKPAFRDAFRHSRCLVPASGYYEWRTIARAKYPWYLRPADASLFGLAALAATWQGPRGSVRSLALITTPANSLTARIHERMPLIIAPADYAAWLDPGSADLRSLKDLVRPYPAERMSAHAVSARVNTLALDDAALIEPLAQGPQQPDLL